MRLDCRKCEPKRLMGGCNSVCNKSFYRVSFVGEFVINIQLSISIRLSHLLKFVAASYFSCHLFLSTIHV